MRGFEIVKDEFREFRGVDIKLPTRSDKGSAGYDFYSPTDFEIQETKVIPMDVKAYMQEDEVLLLWTRSSMGIKNRIVLANQTGVIDSSYYNNENNDGNICTALTNMGDKIYKVNAGDKIMQGVFTKYLMVDNDKPINQHRNGGIGSSGR